MVAFAAMAALQDRRGNEFVFQRRQQQLDVRAGAPACLGEQDVAAGCALREADVARTNSERLQRMFDSTTGAID